MKWRLLGLGLVVACGDDGSAMRDLDAASCNAVEQTLPVATAYHVLGDVMYPDPPPVGGNHNQCWATWGVHDEAVPDENWVHNLEHGGVVYLYNCPDGCQADVDRLKAYVDGRERALLTSYALMPTRFAVVAWGVRLTADCVDMPRFMQFYSDHVGMGLENITSDPPRSCN